MLLSRLSVLRVFISRPPQTCFYSELNRVWSQIRVVCEGPCPGEEQGKGTGRWDTDSNTSCFRAASSAQRRLNHDVTLILTETNRNTKHKGKRKTNRQQLRQPAVRTQTQR